MARSKKRVVLENVEIIDVAAEGKALARVDEKVLFVPFAAPGDIVDIEVTRKKKAFLEGKIVHTHKASELRSVPFCQHFGTCGGCKWQHLNYDSQASYKQKQVTDQLQRIGNLELPEISPILKPVKTQYYRNKLEFTFSAMRWLTWEQIKSGEEYDRRGIGFHVPGAFDKVLDLEACYLQSESSNAIRDAVREYAKDKDLAFYSLREHEGQLRTLVIRTSSTGDLMVILQMAGELNDAVKGLLDFIKQSFPEITSLMYVINNKKNDTFQDLDVVCYAGKDHILEEMEGLKFKVGPKSFYQTNSEQAYELYKVARDFADLRGNEYVYDLYTGTGTIANFIARSAKKVVGLEYVEMAIEDARVNAANNGIDNTTFYAGDMKDLLTDAFIAENGQPNVIITDPPRAGMHQNVIDVLNRVKAQKIVYVSCNPATQARDLALLDENYCITKVQPIDMFPHTHHVENVVLLELR